MKKRVQGFIAGILSGIIAAGTIGVFAYTDYIEAVYNNIKIVVDGKEIHPNSEPFISNGTTYLPVRAVSEALGKEVYWDGPNSTVYIGKTNVRLEYPSATLDDMVNISGKSEAGNVSTLTDNYGHKYSTAWGTDWQWDIFQTLLKGKYSRFKGTLYVPEGTNSDVISTMFIEVDGRTIYTSPNMSKTSVPVDIDIDITNANEFKITYTQEGGYNYFGYNLCLGDAGFYQ